MKSSLRKEITIVFISVMAVAMVLIGVIHFFFFDNYYESDKRKALVQCYEMISSEERDMDSIDKYCTTYNITYMIADSSLDNVQTNIRREDRMITQIFGMIMNKEDKNLNVIFSGDNYQISRFHDQRGDIDQLQLFTYLNSEEYVILESPLQSIAVAASISNRFFIMISLIVIIISAFLIAFITRKLTARVEELSAAADRMANLDFDARYTGGGQDEIGRLGENFNNMSDSLEKAVSQLKSANARLEKDVQEKTEIDEMRREFLSNVSHELKTPIALIQGYAEGLKEMDLDKESQEMYLDVISDEAVKMNRLVMQLMNLEQLESGNDTPDYQCFDLAELISGVLTASKLMIDQAEAEVIFRPEGKVYVWTDEFKIEQVVTNYLTNALHHIKGEKKIIIDCSTENGIVTTTVFNTGDPIPEESLDKLWNKFYKVDKARTRSYGGSGIGLSIVKAIMDAHGQQCYARNLQGGTAFSFTLEARETI